MGNTIVGRILLGYALFALLLLTGLVTTVLLTNGQKDDGLIVNLAGRQRMLSQKMTKETLIYINRSGQSDPREAEKWSSQMQLTMRVFEATLFALKDGGPAPINLEMTNFRQCPAAETAEIKSQLEKVSTLWGALKEKIEQTIETRGQNAEALDYVIANNSVLLKEMDSAVSLMQAESERKVRQFIMIQGGIVVLGIILVIAGSFIVKVSIADPILSLIKAADEISKGNLKEEIPEKGTREIANLAVSFNRMRISLQKMMERLVKKV